MNNKTSNNEKFLFGPVSDFWTLGGLSLVFWVVIFLVYFTNLDSHPVISSNLTAITSIFTGLGLVVNAPHFYWSYKLVYTQGWSFIFKYWFQLIFVPIFLSLLFFISFLSWKYPEANIILMNVGVRVSDLLYFKSYFNFYPDFGSFILGLLLVLQYHTLGWHYAKQAFGVTMINCGLCNYKLTNNQRLLIKCSLLSVWINYVTEVNSGPKVYYFNGLAHQNLSWPTELVYISRFAVVILYLLSIRLIFVENYKKDKSYPPLRVLTPFISLFFWFTPMIYLLSPNYFAYIVPFFHSLQYLTFVVRVEKNSIKSKDTHSNWYLSLIFFLIVFIGFYIYSYLPYILDIKLQSFGKNGTGLFIISSYLLLNIHHYFIDNVLWRGSNRSFRDLLLSHLNDKKI